eukprot:g27504.t1
MQAAMPGAEVPLGGDVPRGLTVASHYGALDEFQDAEAAKLAKSKRRRRVNCVPLLLALLLPWLVFVFCFALAAFVLHYAAPLSTTLCELAIIAGMRAGPIAHVVLLLLASSMVAWAAPGVVVPPGEEEMTPEKAEAIKQAKALTARTRADNDEMLARVISLVIHDASMVRLQNTEPNRSEDCTWPSCAAYCAPCAKTNQYWTGFHERLHIVLGFPLFSATDAGFSPPGPALRQEPNAKRTPNVSWVLALLSQARKWCSFVSEHC